MKVSLRKGSFLKSTIELDGTNECHTVPCVCNKVMLVTVWGKGDLMVESGFKLVSVATESHPYRL